MKTVRFFWNYFKVYKFSFVIVILMVAVATIAQALFPVFSGQAVTELASLAEFISSDAESSSGCSRLSGIQFDLHDLDDPCDC